MKPTTLRDLAKLFSERINIRTLDGFVASVLLLDARHNYGNLELNVLQPEDPQERSKPCWIRADRIVLPREPKAAGRIGT